MSKGVIELSEVDKLARVVTQGTQVELPVTHNFSEGVYVRGIFMPKGTIVVGHVHKTTHINVVSQGKALVWMEGEVTEITAPYTFESKGGVRKVLYILEDMVWSTVHVTETKELEELRDELIDEEASQHLLATSNDITLKLIKEST